MTITEDRSGGGARPRPLPKACRGWARHATDRHRQSRLLPQGRRLPVGVPGAYAGSRIHPPHRRWPLRRRLHGQLVLERLPGDSRPDVRPAMRTCLPARTRRRGTGGDLPPEARRRRQQGRHHRPPSACRRRQRKAGGADRRRAGVADCGARPCAARLSPHADRFGYARRRDDPQPDSPLPPAGGRHRRGGRLHPRDGKHRDAPRGARR